MCVWFACILHTAHHLTKGQPGKRRTLSQTRQSSIQSPYQRCGITIHVKLGSSRIIALVLAFGFISRRARRRGRGAVRRVPPAQPQPHPAAGRSRESCRAVARAVGARRPACRAPSPALAGVWALLLWDGPVAAGRRPCCSGTGPLRLAVPRHAIPHNPHEATPTTARHVRASLHTPREESSCAPGVRSGLICRTHTYTVIHARRDDASWM